MPERAARDGVLGDVSSVVWSRPETRVLPVVDALNEHFWRGGADGELRMLRCRSCRTWLHPPTSVCRTCLSTDLAVEATTGRGTVASYTVNHHQWFEGFPPPYVVALVELDDQVGLRLTTNIVDCAIGDVAIGRPVEVVFEQRDDVWLPLFRLLDV